MFCNSCGNKLKKGEQYCGACGAPVDQGESCGGFWNLVGTAAPAPAPTPAAPAPAAPTPAPAPSAPATKPVYYTSQNRIPQHFWYILTAVLVLLLLVQTIRLGNRSRQLEEATCQPTQHQEWYPPFFQETEENRSTEELQETEITRETEAARETVETWETQSSTEQQETTEENSESTAPRLPLPSRPSAEGSGEETE